MATFFVTNPSDSLTNGVPTPYPLRWAVDQADAATTPVEIDFDLEGSAKSRSTSGRLGLSNTAVPIGIDGPGANNLAVDAGGTTRVFQSTRASSPLPIWHGILVDPVSGGFARRGAALIMTAAHMPQPKRRDRHDRRRQYDRKLRRRQRHRRLGPRRRDGQLQPDRHRRLGGPHRGQPKPAQRRRPRTHTTRRLRRAHSNHQQGRNSPAILAGTAIWGSPPTTQASRWTTRPTSAPSSRSPGPLVVDTAIDGLGSGLGQLSLRQAVNLADVLEGAATTTFDKSAFSTPTVVDLTAGRLELSNTSGPVNILGPGLGKLAISGAGTSRVFQVDKGASTSLSVLTITGGVTAGNGGGLLNLGSVNLSEVAIVGNSATDGGRIDNRGPP